MELNLVWIIVSLGLTVLLFYFLNHFSNMTKNGVNNNNQELVNNGSADLSSYFITVGILLIIGLAFALLAIAAFGAYTA